MNASGYAPASGMNCTNWTVVYAYRSTEVDASSRAVDPVTFDLVNVNQGTLYNRNNGIVTIATSGYYYVYISAGAAQRSVSY